ncbi:MAG: DUF4166 domain-containing protein [Pseudolysinimonas sp.]
MPPAAESPWQRALGDEFDDLHPRLHAYFSAIPAGHVGRGSGSFDVVGTPRRWLWPALRVLQRRRILFPVWERNVAFAVENVSDAGAVRALRTFRLAGGDRQMVDAVAIDGGRLVDRLGDRGVLGARLTASVRDGALCLVSTSARWGRVRIPFAPRVRLTERFDDAVGRQHVALTLESRLFGRIYEYSGHFDYRVEAA